MGERPLDHLLDGDDEAAEKETLSLLLFLRVVIFADISQHRLFSLLTVPSFFISLP